VVVLRMYCKHLCRTWL